MPTPKIDPKIIFASNAPAQDKPAVFNNYTKGMDETRSNEGRPTIKQANALQQTTDQKILWIHENGGALPYDETIDYVDGSIVLKDGELKQKNGADWLPVSKKDIDASDVLDESGKTQQEVNDDQVIENLSIRSEINAIESYIVYAEKYGVTLNEAMDAINVAFVGRRVRIYVPSDFPVTNTVNLNIDCDLDLSTLQVNNDVDVIFNPVVGWSGSSTPCDVFCNKKSVRLGWDLKKSLGYVSLNKMRFFDIGDQAANTSADWFCGFYLQNTGIKKIDLYEPTVINSHVKPNGVVGDTNGSNRLIICEGAALAGASVSDINIYDFHAENFTLSEDSDAVAINVGASTVLSTEFNIDIYNGKALNVQRRAIKIIGHETNSTGIRLHGSMLAVGGGDNPHACVDISGKIKVEWNGALLAKNWIQGLLIWNGAKLIGELYADFRLGNLNLISGTSVRGLITTGANVLIDINTLNVEGGFEAYRNDANNTVKIKKLTHVAYYQTATDNGNTVINDLVIDFKDPETPPTRAAYLISLGTGVHVIERVSATENVATPIANLFRLLNTASVEVNSVKVNGRFTTAVFLLSNASNTKIREAKPSSSQYLVSCVSGGTNLLLDQCIAGSVGLIANSSPAPLTNVVEINTLNF